VIELRPVAVDIARATASGFPNDRLQTAITQLAAADAVVAATPVYKAGMSGLFKSFVDLLDNDLMVAKPVVLAATAGTSRHALVIDELVTGIDRAATELAVRVRSGVGQQIADRTRVNYDHQFDGNATRAERESAQVDFSTSLMSLAAGGRSGPKVVDGGPGPTSRCAPGHNRIVSGRQP